MNKNSIIVHFGNYSLEVYNAKEVYGHDDSWPFEAEYRLKENGVEIDHGSAYDDGWGGEVYVDSTLSSKRYNELDVFCKQTFAYTYKGMKLDTSFADLIGTIAYIYVCAPKNIGKEFNEYAVIEYLEK